MSRGGPRPPLPRPCYLQTRFDPPCRLPLALLALLLLGVVLLDAHADLAVAGRGVAKHAVGAVYRSLDGLGLAPLALRVRAVDHLATRALARSALAGALELLAQACARGAGATVNKRFEAGRGAKRHTRFVA